MYPCAIISTHYAMFVLILRYLSMFVTDQTTTTATTSSTAPMAKQLLPDMRNVKLQPGKHQLLNI